MEELARFVGDGVSARFVETVGSSTVRRVKQYKLAVAMRLANGAATRIQALVRGGNGARGAPSQCGDEPNARRHTHERFRFLGREIRAREQEHGETARERSLSARALGTC